MILTLAEIEQKAAEIEAAAHDPESAHSLEDELREQVLQTIADGCADPQALARAALKTRELDFERWCA